MEDIIKLLQKAKEQALLKDPAAADTINDAIGLVTKKKIVLEAIENPTPAQEDLLPAVPASGPIINAQSVTINYYSDYPPHPFEEAVEKL